MKYFFLTLLMLLQIDCNILMAQPNVCINPPSGYVIGGDFDITIEQDGKTTIDNYLCLPEKNAVGRIGVVAKSASKDNDFRYIFGVSSATIIEPIQSIPSKTNAVLRGLSAGEFWIMQVGEDNGNKQLKCKKIQVDISERPLLELSNCDTQSLTLNITTNNPVSYYSINWNDGGAIEKINYQNSEVKISHKYNQIPPNFIEVTGVYENTSLNRTCNSDIIKTTVPPYFYIKSIETQNFGNKLNAVLEVENPKAVNLDIFISKDEGLTFSKQTSSQLKVSSINNLQQKEQCFKLRYSHSSRCMVESKPVCIINPEIDSSKHGQIDLQWNNVANNATYEIQRKEGGTSTRISYINSTSFSDKQLDCNTNYTYQIIAKYKDADGNNTTVISHEIEANKVFYNQISSVQALVANILTDGKPQLRILDTNSLAQYIIYRSIDDKPFTKIGKIKESVYTDVGNANINQYCYYINSVDACNNTSSNSPTTCTLMLKSDAKELSWNKPINSPNALIHYEILRDNPLEILGHQVENTFALTEIRKRQEQYQVKAIVKIEVGGKIYSANTVSNPLLIDFTTNLYIPTAFSPNGDKLNDILQIKGDLFFIKEFKMLIFNQWGKLVFESNDLNSGWDGNIFNEHAQNGIYVLDISYTDILGQQYKKIDRTMLFR